MIQKYTSAIQKNKIVQTPKRLMLRQLWFLGVMFCLIGCQRVELGQPCDKHSHCLSDWCVRKTCQKPERITRKMAENTPPSVPLICSRESNKCEKKCTKVDNNNCGMCGNKCLEGSICLNGTCITKGRALFCNGVVVDIQMNKEHCGSCYKSCKKSQKCNRGKCS